MSETAWLIEIATPEGAAWLAPNAKFTNDPNNVIRFSRKCDAEAVIEMLGLDEFFTDIPQSAFATEHMWCDPPEHLTSKIQREQVAAGESAVVENLKRLGL